MLSDPLQVLVIRLRDSLIKMGEELSQATTSESQQRESSQYYQRRLEELKADMEELAQREAEASRRCMELVSAGSPVIDSLGLGRVLPLVEWETPACLWDLWVGGKLGEPERG